MKPRPGITTSLIRGIRRRCPHCGESALFDGWFRLRDRCPSCALIFEHSPGDTWGFWVVLDRVFLAALIAGLYFGFLPQQPWLRIATFALAIVLLIATMPHRQGICTALDYLIRRTWQPESLVQPNHGRDDSDSA
jgi:uncharacterized protein (DUF983 family)